MKAGAHVSDCAIAQKALRLGIALVTSWLAYVISLLLVGAAMFGDMEFRDGASTAFVVALSVVLSIHFMLTVAGSALFARSFSAPVRLTMAVMASTIAIAWGVLMLNN